MKIAMIAIMLQPSWRFIDSLAIIAGTAAAGQSGQSSSGRGWHGEKPMLVADGRQIQHQKVPSVVPRCPLWCRTASIVYVPVCINLHRNYPEYRPKHGARNPVQLWETPRTPRKMGQLTLICIELHRFASEGR
jgi:hypothetical protein